MIKIKIKCEASGFTNPHQWLHSSATLSEMKRGNRKQLVKGQDEGSDDEKPTPMGGIQKASAEVRWSARLRRRHHALRARAHSTERPLLPPPHTPHTTHPGLKGTPHHQKEAHQAARHGDSCGRKPVCRVAIIHIKTSPVCGRAVPREND